MEVLCVTCSWKMYDHAFLFLSFCYSPPSFFVIPSNVLFLNHCPTAISIAPLHDRDLAKESGTWTHLHIRGTNSCL